ncbi:VRR-NUC domain-containing protein [Methylocystis sp. FS]|uniref:VRR-NUC domain-containing protein n=1 Tax=Methylocystis silviterrae TaxID=2743612 RepID=UPI0015840BAE|nr:VRR-NUC domain-containing protein [Methylocystis silviterrae]NUJ81828.1 VRR-NUC domain-containing protein [Methylocystis silviterrae]
MNALALQSRPKAANWPLEIKSLGRTPTAPTDAPDFVLIPPTGALHCLELKRDGEELSDAQEDFNIWCVRHGVQHVTAYTMRDALLAFAHWHCLDADAHALLVFGGAI